MAAYELGYQAGKDNQNVSYNPYDPATQWADYAHWNLGYWEGAEETD